jgi:hypothetical protein
MHGLGSYKPHVREMTSEERGIRKHPVNAGCDTVPILLLVFAPDSLL